MPPVSSRFYSWNFIQSALLGSPFMSHGLMGCVRAKKCRRTADNSILSPIATTGQDEPGLAFQIGIFPPKNMEKDTQGDC